MLSVRVAAALARTLPRRAGFVSVGTKMFLPVIRFTACIFNSFPLSWALRVMLTIQAVSLVVIGLIGAF